MQSRILSASFVSVDPVLFQSVKRNGLASSVPWRRSPTVSSAFATAPAAGIVGNHPTLRNPRRRLQRFHSVGARSFLVPLSLASRKKLRTKGNGVRWSSAEPGKKRTRQYVVRAARTQSSSDIEEVLVKVKQDDTLSELALTFNSTVEDWKAINPDLKDEHTILEGIYLRVPKKGWNGKTPRGYRDRIKIHRIPADAQKPSANVEAQSAISVSDMKREGLGEEAQFASSVGNSSPPPKPQSGPWSQRGLQVLLLGILLIIGGLLGLLKRDWDRAQARKAGGKDDGEGSGGQADPPQQVTLNPEGNLADDLKENAVVPTSTTVIIPTWPDWEKQQSTEAVTVPVAEPEPKPEAQAEAEAPNTEAPPATANAVIIPTWPEWEEEIKAKAQADSVEGAGITQVKSDPESETKAVVVPMWPEWEELIKSKGALVADPKLREEAVKASVGVPTAVSGSKEGESETGTRNSGGGGSATRTAPGPTGPRETMVKADAGLPKNHEVDSDEHLDESYPDSVKAASALSNAPAQRDPAGATESPTTPANFSPSSVLSPATTSSPNELAPSSVSPFFAGIFNSLMGKRKEEEVTKPASGYTNGAATEKSEAPAGFSSVDRAEVALVPQSEETSLAPTSAAATATTSREPEALLAPAEHQEQALLKASEGLLALPEVSKTKSERRAREQRQAIDNAVKAAAPALAVGAGAAATIAGGYEGAFEMVGLTALASFVASDLVLAEKRRALWNDVVSIRDHQQLVEFLRNRNFLPKI